MTNPEFLHAPCNVCPLELKPDLVRTDSFPIGRTHYFAYKISQHSSLGVSAARRPVVSNSDLPLCAKLHRAKRRNGRDELGSHDTILPAINLNYHRKFQHLFQ